MTQRPLPRTAALPPAMVALLVVLCFGCTQQKLTQDTCIVHQASGFVGAGRAQGRITVAQNGAPCGMSFVMNRAFGGGFISEPQVFPRPAHGTASVSMSNGVANMVYTPNRDYVGPDSFAVAFGPNYTMTVDVTVVPLGSH